VNSGSKTRLNTTSHGAFIIPVALKTLYGISGSLPHKTSTFEFFFFETHPEVGDSKFLSRVFILRSACLTHFCCVGFNFTGSFAPFVGWELGEGVSRGLAVNILRE